MKILVSSNQLMSRLLGTHDENLRLIESAFDDVRISARGNEISLKGKSSQKVASLIEDVISLLERDTAFGSSNLSRVIDMHKEGESAVDVRDILQMPGGKSVKPATAGQKRYVDAVDGNIITFVTGPAGTGKSWLATALAIRALKTKEVERIILTRPVVEAGESLGFLPGDLMDKVDPYLRPLYDAMGEFLTFEGMQKMMEQGLVEVAPLAYMRGRTLNSSFVILDEAQNATPEQIKMFLTRIGFGTKAVVTGDVTQIDIPNSKSGLSGLEVILGGVEGLEFVELKSRDVIRHPVVAKIVDAYEKSENTQIKNKTSKNGFDIHPGKKHE